MPSIICRRCGETTNTAICDHMNSPDDKADRCWARWVNEKWERGCGYTDEDEIAIYNRGYADKLINES